MIVIKSPREINLMKEAGLVCDAVFAKMAEMIRPGISTLELSEAANKVMLEHDAVSAELGYCGYPAAICASVNEVLLHGIPSSKKILRDGDIISIDIVVKKNGYMADACRTFPVGICKENALNLIKVTEEAFWKGVSLIKEGIHLGDVEHAIQVVAESHGYSVAREFTGHGIGKEMHEDPYIPNYGEEGTGPILKAGMTLAIEPMVMEGKPALRTYGDGWTTATKDGKLSAHYENTIVVTKDGYEVLTMRGKEQ